MPDQSAGDTAERPRLAPWIPVLRRGPDELQLGTDAGTGLVLSGVPDHFEDLLALLDGSISLPDLAMIARSYGIEPETALQLVRGIDAAGLLTRPGTPTATPTQRLRIRLIGAGVLGLAVATALLRAGISRLDIVDPDPVDPGIHPRPGLATTQAEALRLRARSRSRSEPNRDAGPPPAIQVARHWNKPDHPPPDLTVIAVDRAEPDRAIGDDYVRSDHPHLYVRPMQAGAVIGPFVLPGRTPCLGCLDRVRRDADPAWPGLLTQLCRIRLPVLPMLAAWAASTAAVQIACWAGGGNPGSGGGTFELTADDFELRVRPWPMHPACGCSWIS
ncbi:ThiF family adenylyltransferase [Microlunatus endophyticus]|uniref:ThiF family adenylyltransferase n=1 Tax=Microlunatus endophyticus TaxID=1716077 RepID=UPI0016633025|nr:hypothetical protein [Microlunatus endophyticus]